MNLLLKQVVRCSMPLAAALLLAACGSEPPQTVSVTLNLELAAPNVLDPSGTVHLYTYNAYRGTGDLRHPLALIEEKLTFDYGDGTLTHTFDYVPGSGDGFAVYAFLDTDGDGWLCTPTKRDEFAGFAVMDDEPAGEINLTVEMDAVCAGSDRFFPPPM